MENPEEEENRYRHKHQCDHDNDKIHPPKCLVCRDRDGDCHHDIPASAIRIALDEPGLVLDRCDDFCLFLIDQRLLQFVYFFLFCFFALKDLDEVVALK